MPKTVFTRSNSWEKFVMYSYIFKNFYKYLVEDFSLFRCEPYMYFKFIPQNEIISVIFIIKFNETFNKHSCPLLHFRKNKILDFYWKAQLKYKYGESVLKGFTMLFSCNRLTLHTTQCIHNTYTIPRAFVNNIINILPQFCCRW